MAASSASTLSGYGSSFDKQSLGVVLDGTNKSKFSAWDYKLTAFAKQHKLDILLSDPDEYAQSVISAREAIPREHLDFQGRELQRYAVVQVSLPALCSLGGGGEIEEDC